MVNNVKFVVKMLLLFIVLQLALINTLVQSEGNFENVTNEKQVENRAIYKSGHLTVEFSSNVIKLKITSGKKEGEVKLGGELGVSIPSPFVKPEIIISYKEVKVNWGSKLSLVIKPSVNKNCHRVLWISNLNEPLEDCFYYENANWFGGPEVAKQLWPVEKLTFNKLPYVTQMNDNIAITEPYWLNSKGAYIYVNSSTPLFIDSNNHKRNAICFISNDVPPYLERSRKVLDYNVCGFSNPRRAHLNAIGHFIGKPHGIPDNRMVQYPIWSTWVRYKQNVNETSVLKFANEIVYYGFNNSQLEIDDNWESCYGTAEFNTSRFSDIEKLSKQLKDLGFRITIWVHPFVNTDCSLHSELESKGYFVMNINGDINTVWWDGKASVIDMTNPEAVNWFKRTHNNFLSMNDIDGFKFDAGETSWLPQIPLLNCSIDTHPNAFTSAYVDAVSKFNSLTEVRVAHHTQKYPMFVRMLDKDSKWTFTNGLPTLITTMLMMNIQGYPWVLPDMVGGNAYSSDVIDKELFVRWLQANTFMPAIQFSVAPWDFDFETVKIARKFTELHYKYSNKIIELMERTVKTGVPLNPPIWWIDPKNPRAHRIFSEYLLGEDILVAPVIEKGAVRRNIYLPKGCWKDGNYPHAIYSGRQWLNDYKADLSTLPYFIRVSCYRV